VDFRLLRGEAERPGVDCVRNAELRLHHKLSNISTSLIQIHILLLVVLVCCGGCNEAKDRVE
jgi:hypothetical protein